MSNQQFVHLHLHTDYSLLDGLPQVDEIAQFAAENGMPAVAITDHGVLGGAVEFTQACKKHGVKPIIGLEAYHVPDMDVKKKVEDGKMNWHLILLAKNETGYKNLMKISSMAASRGKYGKYARVDDDLLRDNSEGLIATTACLGSRVNQELLNGNREAALEAAKIHRDIFGSENYFVEIQRHDIPEQEDILDDQVWLAEQLGVGLVATNDCHMVHEDDVEVHRTLQRINTGDVIFEPPHHWLKPAEEMIRLFPEDRFPGAISNTVKVAEMVDFEIDVNSAPMIPPFDVPPEYDSAHDLLDEIVYDGAADLYGDDEGNIPDYVRERLEYELDVIHNMGFSEYFLILSDALRWARNQGILIGPGRGSAAGSAAVYCARITDIDPLQYGLYFERFLNPGRASMPDIDIDIEDARRAEVVRYMIQKYGEDRVARIATYGTLKARSAIRDVARVNGEPASTANEILAEYPDAISQVEIPLSILTIPKQSDVPDGWQDHWAKGKSFRTLLKQSDAATQIVDMAIRIEGNKRQTGIHAAAIVVTPTELWNTIPVRYDVDDLGNEMYTSQFDKDHAEAVGALKIDFLGLTSLSMIRRTLSLIASDLGQRIDIESIPFDDPKVFKMLSNGDTEGVFQLSTSTGQDTIVRIQPTQFEDISASIALGRPGPMASNMHIEYAERKAGRSPIETPHKDMDDLLKEELGLPFYQENIMALAQHYAGYTASEADKFRKAMGSKNADVMHDEMGKFIEGVEQQGYGSDLGHELWAIIEPFSGYAFNKSHSVAYAKISYQTAWLKAHFPAQFAAASLDIMPASKIPQQIDFCRNQGINLYAPDINKSEYQASTTKDSIWFGLSGVASCGAGKIDTILNEREFNGPYESLGDFLVRTGMPRPTTRNLIKAGAFDSIHASRKKMLDNLDAITDDAKTVANEQPIDEDLMLFDVSEDVKSVLDNYELDGEDYPRPEKAQMEREALGFFVGRHPFTEYEDKVDELKESGTIPEDAVSPSDDSVQPSEEQRAIYGILTELSSATSRNGRPYSKFVIETDRESRISGMIFGMKLDASSEGKFVVGTGKVRADSFQDEDSDELTLQFMLDDLDIIGNGTSGRRRRKPTGRRKNGRGRGRKREESKAKQKEEQPAPREPLPPVNPPKRQAKPKPEPKSQEQDHDDNVVYLDPIRKRVVPKEDVSSPPKGYLFSVNDADELNELSRTLSSYGDGSVKVSIRFQGEEVSDDRLKFDLNEERARYVAEHVGVKYERL